MKIFSADDSVGFPHVKVGHRQAFYFKGLKFLNPYNFNQIKKHTSFAGVAQLVEQLICNQQVVGSTPIASSSLRKASRDFAKSANLLM